MLEGLKKKMLPYGSDLRGFARELLLGWNDGSIKLYVTFKSLNYRKENPELFNDGTYTPLWGDGNLKDHVCTFARQGKGKVVLVVVPRFLSHLAQVDESPLGMEVWGDSSIAIPNEIIGERFRNIFTGEMVEVIGRDGKNRLILGQVFANFPVAMLETI